MTDGCFVIQAYFDVGYFVCFIIIFIHTFLGITFLIVFLLSILTVRANMYDLLQ